MPRGGTRPGAGRPRKEEAHATPIRDAERRIADRLPFIVDKLLALGDGVYVEETTLDGSRTVYQKPPDRQALTYLFDRVAGKPTERVEQENGGSVEVIVRYAREGQFAED